MRYAFYPGCSLGATAKPYAMSTDEVMGVLGMDMGELEDWNCCGSTAFQTLDEISYLRLSGRNLALAEKSGTQEMVTPCTGCFASLRKASSYLEEHSDLQ